MINVFKLLLIIVAVCICNILTSQIKIDTITTKFEVVKNNVFDKKVTYLCYLDSGDTLVLVAPSSNSTFHRIKFNDVKWKPIDYTENYVFKNGKIYSSDFKDIFLSSGKPICDESFDKIIAKLDGSFLCARNDSIFIMNENCINTFLRKKNYDTRIHASKNRFTYIFIHDQEKSNLEILSSKGETVCNISEFSGPTFSLINYYFLRTPSSPENYYGEVYSIYDYKGNKITEGEIKLENEEVLLIRNLNYDYKYYLKEIEVAFPETISEIISDFNSNLIYAKLKNGEKAIFSNDFKELFKGKFKSIGYIIDDLQYDINGVIKFHKLEENDIFYAIDEDDNVRIYNYLGKEVELDKSIKALQIGTNALTQIGQFQFKETLSAYSILDHEESFNIFDENWDYVTTVKNIKEEKYCLSIKDPRLMAGKNVSYTVLNNFKDKIYKNEFIMLNGKGREKSSHNLIDNDQNIVFDKAIYGLMQIVDNYYILSDRNGGIEYIIRVTN